MLPSPEVVQSATLIAARLMGQDLAGAGRILVGGVADVIVVRGDPLAAAGEVLGRPHEHILVVIKVGDSLVISS